jgi:hypothetical protein
VQFYYFFCQVIVFAAILASMAYLGFHKVSHGLNLSDVTLIGKYSWHAQINK